MRRSRRRRVEEEGEAVSIVSAAEAYVVLLSNEPLSTRNSEYAKDRARTEPWVVRRYRILHTETDSCASTVSMQMLAYYRYVSEAEALAHIPQGLVGIPASPHEQMIRWTFL